jgi:Flp pilus assembly protein TadG
MWAFPAFQPPGSERAQGALIIVGLECLRAGPATDNRAATNPSMQRRMRNIGAVASAMRVCLIRAVGTFCRDESGVILPYLAVILTVLVGFSVLALDSARLFAAQTELQNAADAFALAGAAELDRMPDSALRATNAINHLLGNVWGAGRAVEIADITFYGSLPASDAAPLFGGVPAHACAANKTCSTNARFVAVSVVPVSLAFSPASLFGGPRTIATGASAVAGADQVACNMAPLFVCNPFETPDMSYGDATQALVAADGADANDLGHRQLIRLAAATGGAYGPGNFGYLNPATGYLPAGSCGPSAQSGIAQALTSQPPPACFRLSNASIASDTGSDPIDGLNTRFDIFANAFAGCLDYAPDQNVRKGYTAATPCRAMPASNNWPLPGTAAAALPPDNGMITSDPSRCGPTVNALPCLDVTATLGDGVWDCATYWARAYGGQSPPSPPSGCSSSAAISRYGVYQYEIANGYLNARSAGGETGAPVCSANPAANARLVDAAIVNCLSTPRPIAPGASRIPVAAFGKFFLTLPANGLSGQNLYAEFVALEKPRGGFVRDLVQLYR